MAVSYLSLLQQIRQQPDLVQRLGSGIGQFAQASIADARERAKIEQTNIQNLLANQQYQQAAQQVGNLRRDLQLGYGMNVPFGPVRGTPTFAPLQGPPVPPAMRAGMRPDLAAPEFFRRQTGERFDTPEAIQSIYAGAMLERPKQPPIRVGDALYFPETGEFKQAPAEMMQPKMGFVRRPDGSEIYTALTPGTISAPAPRAPRGEGRERAPRLISTYDPASGEMVVREMRPGLSYAPAPFTGFAPNPENPDEVMPIVMPRVPVKPGTRPVAGPGKPAKWTPLSPNQEASIKSQAAMDIAPEAMDPQMAMMLINKSPSLKAEYSARVQSQIRAANEARRVAAGASVGTRGGKPKKSRIEELLGE